MKIVDVRARVMKSSVPEFHVGGGVSFDLDLASTIVEIESDEGIIGRGETTLARGQGPEETNARAVANSFKPMLLGEDPRNVLALWEKLWSYTKSIGYYGPMSALDQALWDLKARALGVPLYQLLGGKFRSKIRAYATSAIKKSPDEHVADIKRYIELGIQGVKLGIGRGVEEDKKLIRKVVEAAEGRIKVAFDANAFYTSHLDAEEIAQVCDEVGVFWLEEPLMHSDLAGLAYLNNKYRTPISGYQTETTAARMKDYLALNALEIYQPRICLSGGITQSKLVAEMCDVFNKTFIPHAMGSGLKNATSLHLVAATRNAGWIEYPLVLDVEDPRKFMTGNYLASVKDISMDENGFVTVPEGPGNGVELSDAAVKEYQVFAA